MGKVSFKYGTASQLTNAPYSEGTFYVISDNGSTDGILYADLNNKRICFGDVASLVDDVSELSSSIPIVPTNVSDFTNDAGYLTSYTETDPTVPSWAKASTKPSYNFSEIGSTPTTISGYGITDAYTKTQVDGLVAGVLHYKGTKTTVSNLPTSGNTTGDTWHITADGSEWAWDGTIWQELGTAVDLSNYVTTNDSRLSDARTPTAHNQALSTITGADDLKAIEELSGTNGLLKKTAANTWMLDTSNYLTSYTEIDPVFSASVAANISSTDISNWNSKTSNTGTVTSIGLTNATNGGLTISGSPITNSGSITVGHSNILSSAQTTQAVYPIKIDKNGHISAYGSAVSIPTKVSDLTNDSGYLTMATLPIYDGTVV